MAAVTVGRSLKTARAVLHVLKEMECRDTGLSTDEVADITGKSAATATYLLNSLVAEGFAERVGTQLYQAVPSHRILTDLAAQPAEHIAEAVNGWGASMSAEEFAKGFVGVSSPVFGPEGEVVAAIGITVTRSQFDKSGERLVPVVRRLASEASQRLAEASNSNTSNVQVAANGEIVEAKSQKRKN